MDSHRLFLSHSSVDTDAAVQLARRIEDAPFEPAIKVWIDANQMDAGRKWQAQLETALADSTAFAVYVGSRGVTNWVWDEVAVALDRAHSDARYRVIPILAKGLNPASLPSFLRQYHCVCDVENDPSAFQQLMRAVTRAETPQPIALEAEPFQGLEAFDKSRAHLFFGREAETRALVELLRQESLVIVVGDSGSGKSSLVRAGVVPMFLGGAFAKSATGGGGNDLWQVVETRPSNEPFEHLANALRDLALKRGAGPRQASEIADLVRTRETGKIRDAIQAAAQLAKSELRVNTLIIVDQFEELFTLNANDTQKTFTDVLLGLSEGPVRTVLTMRWDYYALVSTVKDLYDRIEANGRRARYALRRMSDNDLRRCVTEPLKLAGVGEAQRDALATAVMADIGDRANHLALLAMALRQTWTKRAEHGGDLLRSYIAIGRVDGALAKAADEAIERLSAEDRALAESLFMRLVRMGDTGGATRRIALKSELVEARWALAQKLADKQHHRLVVVAESTAEIAHEAIVTSWPQYAVWLRNDVTAGDRRADDKRILDSLMEDARRWLLRERDREHLAQGAELAEYSLLRQRRAAWLAPQEDEFISASAAEVRRRRRVSLAKTAGLAAGLTLAVSALVAGVLIGRSPASAWVDLGIYDVLKMQTALVAVAGDDLVRATSTYHSASMDDDSGGTAHHVVRELDVNGRVRGCFGYTYNEAFGLSKDQCNSLGGLGSLAPLAQSARQLESLERGYDDHVLGGSINPRLIRESYDDPRFRALEPAALAGLPQGTEVKLTKVYAVGNRALLAFATLEREYQPQDVVLRSEDEGQTWRRFSGPKELSTPGVMGLARASADWRVLYLAARDDRVSGEGTGSPGGLLRSEDGGESWKLIPLTGDWKDWRALSGVAAHPDQPGVLAVALDPAARGYRTRPPNVPGVLLSTDAGKSWRPLAEGLKLQAANTIYLVGMTRTAELVAVLEADRRGGGGRLTVRRPLTLLERLQGQYRE